jgi:hypothetical protein
MIERVNSSASLPLLVIDKSFARAMKAEKLVALSAKYCFLVPSAFCHEIFDSDPDVAPVDRPRTLAGLGSFWRLHIPTFLRRETDYGEPLLAADLPRLHFNLKMLSPDWMPSPEESAIIDSYRMSIVVPELRFWKDVIKHGVIGFSAEEFTAVRGTDVEFLSLCETLCDRDRIRRIASELHFPHASLIDESWLHYRFFQARILQGLVLSRRYRNPGDMLSDTRIEHDLQDLEYLMLGLHAKRLATNDTSEKLSLATLGWRFKLLEPQGLLLTPQSV